MNYREAVEQGEGMIMQWDRICENADKVSRLIERGEAIAANLRGTLKNNCAACSSILSQTYDLEWIIQEINKLKIQVL